MSVVYPHDYKMRVLRWIQETYPDFDDLDYALEAQLLYSTREFAYNSGVPMKWIRKMKGGAVKVPFPDPARTTLDSKLQAW
jgi:hypothetical protein